MLLLNHEILNHISFFFVNIHLISSSEVNLIFVISYLKTI